MLEAEVQILICGLHPYWMQCFGRAVSFSGNVSVTPDVLVIACAPFLSTFSSCFTLRWARFCPSGNLA